MSKAVVLRGGCDCGRVTYASTAPPRTISHCHCTICQRVSAAPFMTFGNFTNEDLAFSSSSSSSSSSGSSSSVEASIRLRRSSIGVRGSCVECGTPLFMKYHCKPDETDIAMGSVREHAGKLVAPNCHIFVDDRPPWAVELNDGLEKFGQFTPLYVSRLQKWKDEGAVERQDV